MPVTDPRPRSLVPLNLPLKELMTADASTLLAILKDKTKLLTFRSVPAMRLSECRGNRAAAQALAGVLNVGQEHLNLRVIAAISLGQLGGPVAAEALKKVVLNRAEAKHEAPDDQGGQMPFQGLAAQALSDFPQGQEALRQILRSPGGYGMAWALALVSLHGKDNSTLIGLASTMAGDKGQPWNFAMRRSRYWAWSSTPVTLPDGMAW